MKLTSDGASVWTQYLRELCAHWDHFRRQIFYGTTYFLLLSCQGFDSTLSAACSALSGRFFSQVVETSSGRILSWQSPSPGCEGCGGQPLPSPASWRLWLDQQHPRRHSRPPRQSHWGSHWIWPHTSSVHSCGESLQKSCFWRSSQHSTKAPVIHRQNTLMKPNSARRWFESISYKTQCERLQR